MKKVVLSLTILAALSTAALADVVIGDWETGFDGWGNWVSNAVATPTNFALSSAHGVTLHSSALEVTQDGWAQGLAVGLNASQAQAMKNNKKFSIDMSVAASNGAYTAGFTQIYAVAFNASGAGYVEVASSTPINFYWWDTAGERTQTLTIDMTAFTANMEANPSWAQIVFSLNTGGGAPAQMYFDNARFWDPVPEPATMTLLGLGLALLRRRK